MNECAVCDQLHRYVGKIRKNMQHRMKLNHLVVLHVQNCVIVSLATNTGSDALQMPKMQHCIQFNGAEIFVSHSA